MFSQIQLDLIKGAAKRTKIKEKWQSIESWKRISWMTSLLVVPSINRTQ